MRKVALVGLLVAGCAPLEDGFVGRFSGVAECSGRYVSDGAAYTEGPLAQTIRIEHALDGSIYVAGACTISLDVLGAQRAEVLPSSCVRPGGTMRYVDGVIALDEPQLGYVISAAFDSPDPVLSYTASCSFEGTRIE
jgi:hypothetical protein